MFKTMIMLHHHDALSKRCIYVEQIHTAHDTLVGRPLIEDDDGENIQPHTATCDLLLRAMLHSKPCKCTSQGVLVLN